MWAVVVGSIPIAVVGGVNNARVVLSEHGAAVGVACPAVELALRALHHQFHTVGITLGREHVGFEVVVHKQNGSAAIVEVVVHGFIVTFDAGFDISVLEVSIDA